MFRLTIGKFTLHYDRNYGVYHLSGWSFAWNGSWRSQFTPTPIHAMLTKGSK